MKKRRKHKIVIECEILLLCMMVAILKINAASSNPPSKGVSYNKNGQVTIENALDNLYSKANYGNATANDILKGKKALVGGKEVIGTYNAPTLASLTPGNAIASNIDEGKVAWVNGNKIVGTKKPSSLASLRVGDYISYTPSKTSYKVLDAGTLNGYKYIDPSSLRLWRMIRRTGDGTIELVSVSVSDTTMCIQGTSGYLDYIKILNDAAKGYETDGYTIGSRHMGYDGKALEQLTSVGEHFPSDEGYKTDVELVAAIDGVLNAGHVYFLASRDRAGHTNFTNYGMDYGRVYMVGAKAHDGLNGIIAVDRVDDRVVSVTINGDRFVESGTPPTGGTLLRGSIRPIIYLNPDLKITGGDGTEETPYTLGL